MKSIEVVVVPGLGSWTSYLLGGGWRLELVALQKRGPLCAPEVVFDRVKLAVPGVADSNLLHSIHSY